MRGTTFLRRVSEDRLLNPRGAPQLFETAPGQGAVGEWELPRNAAAYQQTGDVILTLPGSSSRQAHIDNGRFVLAGSENGHINRAAQREAPEEKQFQFTVKLPLPSAEKPGYIAPPSTRIARWSNLLCHGGGARLLARPTT